MPSPAQIVIEFGGSDALVEEGMGEVYWLASVTTLAEALAKGIEYANWRRNYMARGVFILGARASLVTIPPVSDSTRLLLEGTDAGGTGGDERRDILASGLLYRCKSADGTAKGNRTYRGFTDEAIRYTAAGQESEPPFIAAFTLALRDKLSSLGFGLNALSRDPAVTLPKPIPSLVVVDGVLTGFTATGAGGVAGYTAGGKINVKGAKGPRAALVNGRYNIAQIADDVISVTPQKTIPQGFVYVAGSGSTYLRVPSYPVIEQVQFQRFATKQTGNSPSRRRSRQRRVA
jgi:hypothetical protein